MCPLSLARIGSGSFNLKHTSASSLAITPLWAEVNGLYGAEYWAAASQGQENTIVFTVRWFSALDKLIFDAELTKYRVVYRGRYFDIQSFDNVEQKNILVKIKAIARG